MLYGIRYDRKLNMWVVIHVDTGKIYGKYDSKEKADAMISKLYKEFRDGNPKR